MRLSALSLYRLAAAIAVAAVALAAQTADGPLPQTPAQAPTPAPQAQTPTFTPSPPTQAPAPVPVQTLPAPLPQTQTPPSTQPTQTSTPPPPAQTPPTQPTQTSAPTPPPAPSTTPSTQATTTPPPPPRSTQRPAPAPTQTQTPTPPPAPTQTSTQTPPQSPASTKPPASTKAPAPAQASTQPPATKTATPKTPIQTALEALIKTRKYNPDGLGVVVKDLSTGAIVAALNADAPMNPASVQKLITGAAAFEMLGPSYVFGTRVYTDGEFLADSGIITGNLYIRGTGEPGINAEKMWLLVQHLRHRGVRRIAGDIAIDNYFFDNVGMGPGYSEDESRSYQALISALPLNYSSFAIHHRPGEKAGSPVVVDIFPKVDGVKLDVTATTVEGKGRIDVSTALVKGVTTIKVRGTMSLDDPPTYTYRRMWQTWESFGGAFRTQCVENGIKITGKVVRQKVPDTLLAKEAFYTYGGEPVTEFVKHMFKWSSNFIAEMLFKAIGALRVDEPGSWSKGTAAVTAWWERRGLPGVPQIINGSGMGGERTSLGASDSTASNTKNENRVSPAQIVALLTYVYEQKRYYPDYLAALSSAGVDGTLRSRFQRSKLKGVVRAKTGTLNSVKVSTLAGYMFLDDKTYAFAVFCKNVGPNQYDNWIMQEQILELFARPTEWK